MYSLQKYGVLLGFAFFSAIIFSCNSINSPKNEIPEPVFRAVLVDAFLAESYVQEESTRKSFNAASLMNQKIYPVILKKHNVDSAAFIHTFEYYLHRPEEFQVVLTKVQDSMNIILQNAPLATSELAQPPTSGPIESDSALAEDAINRFQQLQKLHKKQQQPGGGQPGKKTN